MRDHNPITIDQFNGLYDRGDIEEVPLDHFSECNNIKFIGNTGFGTRDGIENYQDVSVPPLQNIVRIYNYPMVTGNTQLVLVQGGYIYHIIDQFTMFGPILVIPAMTDFSFVSYDGRAYITPFTTELTGELNRERGLQNDFLYVYLGDGNSARKAAGDGPPISPSINTSSAGAGFTDSGLHTFGVVYETNTGYLSPPGALDVFDTSPGNRTLNFASIPVSPDSFVIARHLVASKVITDFNGDRQGYQFFFIPDATLNDNTTTVLNGVNFYDADLLDDASHLFDNFPEIGAGVNLCIYHNRLCITTLYDSISIIYVSQIGEPEAISQIDGFCIVPPNGDSITNISPLRDVLYAFKRNKTVSFVDNGQEPSSWPYSGVDMAMGAGVHSIATVVDSGSSNIDYLVIGTYTGIVLFNGRYILPELSWKIAGFWNVQAFKTDNWRIQICNDSQLQRLYAVLTDGTLLYADYSNGFDPKKIKWTPWSFDSNVFLNTIALINVNDLTLGF